MSLNLLTDPWIPVLDTDGRDRLIAPWQVADRAIARLNWPRPDLNIACLELLIGLVFMADPPQGDEDWEARQSPDPARLRDRLAAFAPAFNLLGDGPRFMQDLEHLEGDISPVDMMFIDSASNIARNQNKDIMVHRDRYTAASLPLAAITLFTTQVFAYSDSSKHRACMRGNGPVVSLVDPGQGVWNIIWANVPDGQAATAQDLPWMRRTVTSETKQPFYPEQAHPVEAFFGMPWRVRLVEADGEIVGFVRRPFGTRYVGWDHPLTPYHRKSLEDDWQPTRHRAGLFGYPNWLGVVIASEGDSGLTRRAQSLRNWPERSNHRPARVIVAGWSMDKAKPCDFILSMPPLLDLTPERAEAVAGMVRAADQLSLALRMALMPVLAEGAARDAVREAFFAETQADFEALLTRGDDVSRDWLAALRVVAMELFEARALPGLADRDMADQQAIVQAHRNLARAFDGYGKYGGAGFDALGLPRPATKKETAA